MDVRLQDVPGLKRGSEIAAPPPIHQPEEDLTDDELTELALQDMRQARRLMIRATARLGYAHRPRSGRDAARARAAIDDACASIFDMRAGGR